jgi:hypothetical protein
MTPQALGILAGGLAVAAAALAPLTGRAQSESPARGQSARGLRPPSAFAGISDPAERSAALFAEAGKVLQHPRCLNCHPDGDRPSQGNGYPHQPPVQRGADGLGVTAMRCPACHQATNFEPGRVPGHPQWHLAPVSMAWQGRSLAEVCAQVKDSARNGGQGLPEIIEHMAARFAGGLGVEPRRGS